MEDEATRDQKLAEGRIHEHRHHRLAVAATLAVSGSFALLAVMAALIHHYEIRADELNRHRAINSERDLVISILGFLQAGMGGERWVASSAIVEAFSARFVRKITLGGTSVRAVAALALTCRSR